MIKYTVPVAILLVVSCTKGSNTQIPKPGRTVSDSLLVYQVNSTNGNGAIFSKNFTKGDSNLLVSNATMPYVASQRMVYIKSGKTLGYSKLNGISRFLFELNEPSDPCLSIDARLICVVDKTIDEYQLLVMDTLGSKTTLYHSSFEIKQPEFSTDGVSIFFSQKTETGNFTIYKINSGGGTPMQLIAPVTGINYTDCAATADRLYFLQSRTVSGKFSTEICSVNLSGSDFQKNTDFTVNWSQPGFVMQDLRKVNSSTLIFISEYGSTNKEIFLAKVDNLSFHSRITYTDNYESHPNLVPAFVKDF
jgi:Tol biopolymer transport system component